MTAVRRGQTVVVTGVASFALTTALLWGLVWLGFL